MRIARSMPSLLLALLLVSPAHAQVSCANPDDLCTGDPCTTVNVTVQSPCVVDFGARALVIGGALTVPSGGTLSLTAASIRVQGRIEGPGASVTLVANAGVADLRTEIDVAGGSIDVSATGNVDVKNRLKAKAGGSIALTAGGALATDGTAVLEAQGGSIVLTGAAGVTIGGRVFVEDDPVSGTIQIDSSTGVVTLDKDLRVRGGSATLNGATGVVVNDAILAANSAGMGGAVTLASATGDVAVNDKIRATGMSGGSIVVTAPLGTVEPRALDVKGKVAGGSVSITAATITLRKGIDAEAGIGNGGTIGLVASTVLTLAGADLDVHGKVNGGAIGLLGALASGDVTVTGSGLNLAGGSGNGGLLVVSAPAGAVTLVAKANLTGKGMGGQAFVDGVALVVGPKSRFDADGRTLGGGELRFNQSGAGLFQLAGTFEARADGVIEALAPAGSLTASGDFRAGPAGCVGASAGGTLDTTGASADVPLTSSCP